MNGARIWACAAALGVSTVAVCAPSIAHACGGCFTPPNPTGTPTPVTAHRMAVALSPTETTLWDQIEYAGAPEDFVWVLPIAGTSTVELADNGFFEALQATTQIFMEGPPPPRTTCADPCSAFGFGGFASGGIARDASESGGMPPVEVHHEGVVGPYETATIGSDDPDALVAWLRDHDYQVPDDLLPTIRHYVDLDMNFVVLRLRPSTNVQRMQPVRITVPGLQTSFPLRMVAAGIVDHVALELFVFAESRIEASNFGNAEVDRAAITFDWASFTFDYDARFGDALFAGDGDRTNWVAEFAGPADPSIGGFRTVGDDGVEHSAADDWAVVTRALASPYLTRLRTDLPVSELDQDLGLQMSEGADIGTYIRVTREANRAPEPDCPAYCAAGDATGPGGSSLRGAGRSRCSASPGASDVDRGALFAVLVALGAVVVRRRRG